MEFTFFIPPFFIRAGLFLFIFFITLASQFALHAFSYMNSYVS